MPKSSRRLRHRAKALASEQDISYQAALQRLQQPIDEKHSTTSLPQVINHLRNHRVNGKTVPLMLWAKHPGTVQHNVETYCQEHQLQIKKITPSSEHDVYVGLQKLFEHSEEQGIVLIENISDFNAQEQAALLEFCGEGAISYLHWQLPVGWNIIAIAPEQCQLDEAFLDRFLHWVPEWDAQAWAKSTVHQAAVDIVLHSEKQRIATQPQLPLDIANKLRATPRSLMYFQCLWVENMNSDLQSILAYGLLGKNSKEFIVANQ